MDFILRNTHCFLFKRAVAIFAFLLVQLCVFLGALHAEQRELKTDTPEHIDAVLLLDNSGSMLLTDPERLRVEGAKLFIQLLKAGDRLAIIEFARDAKVILPLTEFDPNKVEELTKQISKLDSSGQYTDLFSGVKAAQELLKKDARKGSSQLIILMSDGKMDPDPSLSTVQSRNNELFNAVIPDLKSQEIKVHTLSFSEQADRDILAQIAAGSEGMSMYTPDASKIHESYANLFLAVKKPQVLPLTARGFRVDANVQEATFYINRETGAELSIQSPLGIKYGPGVTDEKVRWFRGQKFDVITVISPEPGDWQVVGLPSQDGFATVLTSLKLVTDWPSSINSEEEMLLQARLYEAEKPVVLPEMTGAVNYAFQITPTDKISEPVVKEFLHDDGKDGDKIADDGIFSALVRLNDPGEYTLKVVAHAPTFDRYQQIPFRVRPRMVSLSIAKRAVEDAHAEEDHGDDDHSKKDEHASEEHHDDEKEEGENKPDEDFFIVRLSPEVRELKSPEVEIMAVDKSRKRYSIKMEETSDPFLYELPASILPQEGHYEIQATLTGQTKAKKTIKASSEKVLYLRRLKESEGPVVNVEAPKEEKGEEVKLTHDKPKKEEPPSPILYIIIATVCNLGVAGLVLMLMKKSAASSSIQMPSIAPIEPAKEAVVALRKRIEVSEISLDDPILTGKGSGAEDSSSGSAASTQSPADSASAATESSAEATPTTGEETPAAEESPPPETTETENKEAGSEGT